jgi:N-acetylglutamate synthase-like GNAT family acetyltransferase
LSGALVLSATQDNPTWPLTLREGLPASLPGYAAAPTDRLPEDAENEMGPYVEVARFFQRIESQTSTKQFRIAIQDYTSGKDLGASLRAAFAETKKTKGIETRETEVSGHKIFVVTDRSTGRPTTLATVIVLPSRLVLGQGANVTAEEALQLSRDRFREGGRRQEVGGVPVGRRELKDRHPVVRSARREDGPRIIELDRELALLEKLPPPDDVEAERLLSWIFESKKLEALVAELKGRIEGVALFYEGLGSFRARPFLYLEDLVISEEARGHGIGEALMAALARGATRARCAWNGWS